MIETDSDYPDLPEGPSKSELKRQMQARQKLGEKLAGLNKQQLETIPLDSTLLEALADYQRFRHNEARRRQLQFIGKLMRNVDVELVEHAYQLTQAGSEASKKIEHKLEYWRDKILAQGDATIQDAINEFPGIDRQQLRQFIRDAKKERDENKAPTASRKLFKYLKQEMNQAKS